MPTFAELGEAIERDYQERAKDSPRVDLVAAVGKRLAAHVVTKWVRVIADSNKQIARIIRGMAPTLETH